MNRIRAVGVDACRSGWCVVVGDSIPNVILVPHLMKARDLFEGSDLILIDMPMGLPDQYHPRTVEAKARKLLPQKSSSIFGVPSRGAVYASSYREAKSINLKEIGKSISIQSWNIVPKIKELDQFLKNCHVPIYEAHPELCFHFLQKENHSIPSKKSLEGVQMRKDILKQWSPELVQVYHKAIANYKRVEVAKDDILDAMILWTTAQLTIQNQLHSLGSQYDRMDILMSMHYVDPFDKV